ncbi:chorismate-binding protein [Botryobacter ruber]|uniref:chorismate-binding protein n=1 Tax=Botryobacter ruber TaxID=2171629 RepID=UPI000E0C90B0|nr:chorismate-binding protein [Botryobacter ruber]
MTKAFDATVSAASGTEPVAATLSAILTAAVKLGFAVAAWRLPETSDINIAVSLRQQHAIAQPVLENSPFGFLFCPFQANEAHGNLFIKADIFYNSAAETVVAAADAPPASVAAYYEVLEHVKNSGEVKWHVAKRAGQELEQPETAFKDAVKAAVAAIEAEEMEKVVLSRKDCMALPETFSPAAAFLAMAEAYPRAFVSLVSVPETGTWLGASPEILVSIDQQQIFRTVALAGTQPLNNATTTANAIWRQKEIEEQSLVERYVINCFKKIRLREYMESGPKTVIAGNLMHLRTDFKVDMKEQPFPTLGSDMLHLLHPTSAVCGMPKEPALSFILEHEGYDRCFFSGFLGPVSSAQGTHIYVNLRCTKLLQQQAIIYAGAGITAESSPEKEWVETKYKMLTVSRVLESLGV